MTDQENKITNLETDKNKKSDDVKFHYDLIKIEEANKLSQKGMIGSKIINLTNNKTRKEYYKYLYRKNPDKFSIVIKLDNNKEISFNYDNTKFDNFGKCTNLDSLIEIEPKGTKLSDEEKKTAIEKLGNTISGYFVPFHIDDPALNSAANRATRLFKASASAFLENEQQISYATMDYLKTTNKTIINYSNEKNLDSQESISNVYNAVLPEMSKSIVVNFKNNEKEFIKNFLDGSNVLCVEKIFDSLKEKGCGFIEFISKEYYLSNLDPEQLGKLAAVISRQAMLDGKLKDICEKIATVISNYDESKIQIFSDSFANNVNGLFFRKDEKQMRADNYASITLNIVKYLNDNEVCKNNIITNVYNIMPNFVDPSKKLSKLSFVEGLENANITVEDTVRNDAILSPTTEDIIKYNTILTSCATIYDKKDQKNIKKIKNDIKTPEEVSTMLADLVCNGRIERDVIQTYFKGIKNLGFDITDIVKLTANKIKEKKDDNLLPFSKEALINNLCAEYKNYEEQTMIEINKVSNSKTSKSEKVKLQKDIKKCMENISSVNKFLADKIINEINKNPIKVKDEKGKFIPVSSNNPNSIELYFQQEERSIENLGSRTGLARELEEEYKAEKAKLEKNKAIIQKLQQNNPNLFVKSNESIRSIV